MTFRLAPYTAEAVEAHASAGAFIMASSVYEVSLHSALTTLLKLAPPVSRLLIGEPRIGDLIGLVRRAAEMAELDEGQTRLLGDLCDLGVQNNKIRQIVAHKPCIFRAGAMVFHNKGTAKTKLAEYEYRCTAAELINQANLIRHAAMMLDAAVSREHWAETWKHLGALASLRSNPLPAIPSQPLPPKLPKQPPQRPASQE